MMRIDQLRVIVVVPARKDRLRRYRGLGPFEARVTQREGKVRRSRFVENLRASLFVRAWVALRACVRAQVWACVCAGDFLPPEYSGVCAEVLHSRAHVGLESIDVRPFDILG